MSSTYDERRAVRAAQPAAKRPFTPRPQSAGRPVLHLKCTAPELRDAAAGQAGERPAPIVPLS
jgi:hypothetical protein